MFNFYPGYIHHKLKENLEKGLKMNNISFTTSHDITKAKYVYSASKYINPASHPTKKFIFGPQFSVFPNGVPRFNNVNKNAKYIVPSLWVKHFWEEYKYNNIPLHIYPVGVDTDKFKPGTKKNKIFIYFKRRDPNELNFVLNFVKSKNIEYKVFDYMQKYKEIDYINYVKECKFGIWIGTHESQGFALLESLSMGTPLLIWNVSSMSQENNCPKSYYNIKTKATTTPYWTKDCGEHFYSKNDFYETYENFTKNLSRYNPRKYVVDNLELKKQTKKFIDLFETQ